MTHLIRNSIHKVVLLSDLAGKLTIAEINLERKNPNKIDGGIKSGTIDGGPGGTRTPNLAVMSRQL